MSTFKATPTMREFMLAPHFVRILAGPIGGGKSVACVHELVRLATLQEPNSNGVRKTRALIVRNTADQLAMTTRKTVFDWLPPGLAGQWKAVEKTFVMHAALPDGSRVESEWIFLPLDHPDDVRKALSLEATFLWGNECRELHPDVVDGLLGRVNRYPSMKDGGITRAAAIFDTNMPEDETWWANMMDNPPKNWSVHTQPPAVLPLDEWIAKYDCDPDPDMVGEDTNGDKYAVDPACDNFENLERSYYPNTLERKTPDYVRVYLRAQFGRSFSGIPVYDATFREERHVSKSPLAAINSEEYPLCVALDFGRTPTALVLQATPLGTVNVLAEVTGENMGIQTFVKTLLKPHLFKNYPGMPMYVVADPAGWQKSQVGETSPADVLKAEGFRLIKAPTNNIDMRIEAVETLLSQASDTRARLQIDPSCKALLQGFRGRYRWKTQRSGELAPRKEPEKNHPWSDVHDCLQYAASVIDGGLSGARHRQKRKRELTRRPSTGWT